MKQAQSKSHLKAIIVIMIGLFGIGGKTMNVAEQIQFDSLYPKTWYTKATENCVQVWGSLDQLLHKPFATQSHSSLERAIGQLVFAQSCFDRIKYDRIPPSVDHLYYLSRVIGTIADHTTQMNHGDEDRMHCLKNRIEKMKKRVESYFPKDRSLATAIP